MLPAVGVKPILTAFSRQRSKSNLLFVRKSLIIFLFFKNIVVPCAVIFYKLS